MNSFDPLIWEKHPKLAKDFYRSIMILFIKVLFKVQ